MFRIISKHVLLELLPISKTFLCLRFNQSVVGYVHLFFIDDVGDKSIILNQDPIISDSWK